MRLKLLVATLIAAVGVTANADPVIDLPDGPLYIKFDNREQIAVGGASTGYANEINWGVITVSTINQGIVTGTNVIESTGPSFFTNISSSNAQITGIFYGIEASPTPPFLENPFPAKFGTLDLYWRDLDIYSETDLATSGPAIRTAQDKATGFTEGTLLARLNFASGILSTDPNTFIFGSVNPTPGTGFAGLATSYANVDGTTPGEWSDILDSDWFTTAFGTRDFRFRNIYEELASWNTGDCSTGSCLLGARSTDPATAFVTPVPEPATLALVGLSLVGLAVTGRRRRT